jgi:hypothetical protein
MHEPSVSPSISFKAISLLLTNHHVAPQHILLLSEAEFKNNMNNNDDEDGDDDRNALQKEAEKKLKYKRLCIEI